MTGSEAAAEPSSAARPGSADRRAAARRVALAVALVVLAVAAPFVKHLSAQPASRLALTAAIVDGGTIYIDDYEHVTRPIDRIETPEGRLLSDKAAGQPLAAIPVYWVERVAGAQPATHFRIEGNLTLWWVTFWSAMVPLAALAALMYLRADRFYAPVALPVALAMTFATFLLPFGTELYGHVLAAALAYGAWFVLGSDGSRPRARLLGAGALMGAAVFVEYPVALIAVILTGHLLVRRTGWSTLWFVLGGVPFALAVGAYQWAAFGSPIATSYGTKFENQGGGIPTGLPDLGHLGQILAGERGFTLAPVLLLALYGIVRILRTPRAPARQDAVVAAVVVAAFVLLQASWPNPWGGGGPGPRYVVPALPFLAVPLAAAWDRFRILTKAFVVIGAGVMGLALVTENLVGEGSGLLGALAHNLDAEGIMPTVYTLGLGPFGWFLHALVAAGAIYLLVRARERLRRFEAPVGTDDRPVTPSATRRRAAPA